MANSQIGNNEYTTIEQRRQQQATRKASNAGIEVTPAVAAVPATSTATADTSSASNAYADYLAELKAMQAKLKAQQEAQVNAAYNQGKTNLDDARTGSLKEAYVTYMQGLKNMPQIAAAGGNGGYAQSLLNKQQLNYENNRSGIEQNYLQQLAELENNRAAGIVSANKDYTSQMASLLNDDILTKAAEAATGTSAGTSAGTSGAAQTYKVGGQTMTKSELLAYLKSLGMTSSTAAHWMKANGISY